MEIPKPLRKVIDYFDLNKRTTNSGLPEAVKGEPTTQSQGKRSPLKAVLNYFDLNKRAERGKQHHPTTRR